MDSTDQIPPGMFDFEVSRAAYQIPAPAEVHESPAISVAPPIRRTHSGPAGILGLGLESVPAQVDSTRSLLDIVALVLAIVAAPVGLLVGIVAAVLSARRLGYVSGLARAAIVVALVMSVILAAGGVAYSFVAKAHAHEAALRSGSVAMCTIIAATPGRLADPAFGWPALLTTITAYEQEVTAYADWWTKLAASAPTALRPQLNSLARVAAESNNRMMVSKVVQHDQDYADMQKAALASTLPAWVKTYC